MGSMRFVAQLRTCLVSERSPAIQRMANRFNALSSSSSTQLLWHLWQTRKLHRYLLQTNKTYPVFLRARFFLYLATSFQILPVSSKVSILGSSKVVVEC